MLTVINAAFGRKQTPEWFAWKHRRGPWGPSIGWVVEDQEGQVIGARLFLPWQLRDGDRVLQIHRAVDGAIMPSAQRQGLFSRTIRSEMDAMAKGLRPAQLTYSTSVPASRDAYRKLGWTITSVPHRVSPSIPSLRLAADVNWDSAVYEQTCRGVGKGFRTDWSADSLRWRMAGESGHLYRTVSLRQAEAPHGAVVRLTAVKRVRSLAVVHSWGDEKTVKALVRAAATRSACTITLAAGSYSRRWQRTVGSSTVSLWSPSAELTADVASRAKFDLADLEGVM